MLSNDIGAADCVSGVEQFLLHLLLLALDPVHAVLVLVELGRRRPPPSAVGTPGNYATLMLIHPDFYGMRHTASMRQSYVG